MYHTTSAAYCARVDGTLLPTVMDQIFVDSRSFYTPSALLPSLEKGGDSVARSFNCSPCMAGLCLADALCSPRSRSVARLVDSYGSSASDKTFCMFSGQQILGPSKKSSNKIVKDMFKAAKE